MSVQYTGPDPIFIRKIDSEFDDDPDWVDPDVEPPDAETWSTPNVRRGTMHPLTKMLVSFVFYNEDNERVAGGTADIYAFYINEPQVYAVPQGTRPVVRKTGSVTTYDLNKDLVVDVTKHVRMGVRLSNITAPAGATTLRLAVQELS
jgi:hypothetical protein